MTTRTAPPAAPGTDRPALPPHPGTTVGRGLVRQLRRGTVVVALISGGLAAFVAQEYERTFSGALGVSSLTALAENPAIRTLFGPPVALDDPGGFTVWRTGTVVAVFAGMWGALAGTRITRGEEEAGRCGAAAVRAGPAGHAGPAVTRRPARRAGAVVGAAVVVGMLLAGTAPAGSLLFGALIGGTAMAGAALGVLGGQVLARAPRRLWAGRGPSCWPACWPAWSATASPRCPGCGGSAPSG